MSAMMNSLEPLENNDALALKGGAFFTPGILTHELRSKVLRARAVGPSGADAIAHITKGP